MLAFYINSNRHGCSGHLYFTNIPIYFTNNLDIYSHIILASISKCKMVSDLFIYGRYMNSFSFSCH